MLYNIGNLRVIQKIKIKVLFYFKYLVKVTINRIIKTKNM